MDRLKERHGFGPEINDGINWAYAASELDFTSVMIVIIILFMIILSGYLIIHNIFLMAVTSDIHYYGLLKTIGTTNRQLKKIVLKQALSLSLIAIPTGLVLGFVTSYFVFPFIVVNLAIQKCEIIPNIRVFVICALFSWFTVRISCEKPCRFIRKISPVEAVRYNDTTVGKLSRKRKSKKVTTYSMAWENLKRNKRRTVAVLLSMALSIVMINVTVSIVACMDKEKYISNFSNADEGIFRVLLTFALVLTIGLLLNYAIVYLMAGSMIMFSYRYVVWPMLVCVPVFLIIAALIPGIIWRNNK